MVILSKSGSPKLMDIHSLNSYFDIVLSLCQPKDGTKCIQQIPTLDSFPAASTAITDQQR